MGHDLSSQPVMETSGMKCSILCEICTTDVRLKTHETNYHLTSKNYHWTTNISFQKQIKASHNLVIFD